MPLLPLVEGGRTNLVLPTQVGYAGACIVLRQDGLLLGLGEFALTHDTKFRSKVMVYFYLSLVAPFGKPTFVHVGISSKRHNNLPLQKTVLCYQ